MKRAVIKEENLTQGISYPSQPYLLTIKAAAKRFNLPVWSVRMRIWNGELPTITFRGEKKQYVDEKDLAKLIESMKQVREKS